MADPYFVKLNMTNGAEAWVNLGNVTFIYQQPGAQTTVRFAGSTDNQITLKQSIEEVGGQLPQGDSSNKAGPSMGSRLDRLR